jgi:hypothetical protein
MPAKKYRNLILATLQGKTPELQNIPPERLDWNGPGALLELYDQTSGKERVAMIQAIGHIMRDHAGPPPVIAQLVDIASRLDLAEVEPDVRALKAEPVASLEPLRRSIANYLAHRKLAANGHAAVATAGSARLPTPRRSGSRKR